MDIYTRIKEPSVNRVFSKTISLPKSWSSSRQVTGERATEISILDSLFANNLQAKVLEELSIEQK